MTYILSPSILTFELANSKAKIYRGGLVDPSVPSVKLGSIEEILKDEKTGNLTMATLDKYTLKPFDDGVKKMLLCDVFLVSADDSDTKVSILIPGRHRLTKEPACGSPI
jgi:hypothetical protein